MGGTAFSAQPFWQHTHLCRSKRMTTEQERDFPDRPDEARGVRIPEESSSQEAEDVLDPEGYDESQRAEILEAEGRGPTNGVIQTGLLPDDGEGDADAAEVEDDGDELEIKIERATCRDRVGREG